MQNLTKVIEDFHENGIAVVKGFASEAECDAMIAQMRDIVDKTDMKVNSELHRIFKLVFLSDSFSSSVDIWRGSV